MFKPNPINKTETPKEEECMKMEEEQKEIDLRDRKEYKALFELITKLQDEVHRFVITYHRSLRDKIK